MPRSASSQKETNPVPKAVEIDRPRVPKLLIAMVLLGVGVTVGAIAWGRADTGQINVAATINNAPQNAGGSGNTEVRAASAEHAAMPNGGLVPQNGEVVTPPTPEPVTTEATSTATSTEESASETQDGEGSQEVIE